MKIFVSRWGGVLQNYLATLLLWNPLIVTGVVLAVHGTERPGHVLIYANLLGETVYTLCFGAVVAIVAVDARWRRRRYGVAAPRGRGWTFACALLVLPGALWLGYQLVQLVPVSWGGPGVGWYSDVYRLGLVIGSLVALLFFLGRSRADARDAARNAELALKVAENQRLQAQLSALTAKLNPHLLFNALNTVAGLIPTQPAVAEQTVVRLAELYRGVLDSMRRDTHSLAAELHLCEAYLDVEKARFGERLQSSVDEGDEKIRLLEVPVMILQPLIENAVRHGLSSRASGGRVDVRARVLGAQLELSVEDDGVGLGSSSHVGSGTGVAMCRERLRLRYGEGASLDLVARTSGGTRVALRLPLPSPGANAGANGG